MKRQAPTDLQENTNYRQHEFVFPSNEQVQFSSCGSFSPGEEEQFSSCGSSSSVEEKLIYQPDIVLSSEAWLFRKAKSYQDYMQLIPIPTIRGSVIPYNSWVGLGSSIKKLYDQPLHYLTNVQLKRMDLERHGVEDENVPLDMIIHPTKAEVTVWLIEEVHRRTSSPLHLLQLWEADPKYHTFVDAIFPELE